MRVRFRVHRSADCAEWLGAMTCPQWVAIAVMSWTTVMYLFCGIVGTQPSQEHKGNGGH